VRSALGHPLALLAALGHPLALLAALGSRLSALGRSPLYTVEMLAVG